MEFFFFFCVARKCRLLLRCTKEGHTHTHTQADSCRDDFRDGLRVQCVYCSDGLVGPKERRGAGAGAGAGPGFRLDIHFYASVKVQPQPLPHGEVSVEA